MRSARVRLGAGLLTLLALPALAADPPSRAPRNPGLELPDPVLRWELPHEMEGRPGHPAVRTCRVFRRHAVLSNDEGQMGVSALELRVRPAGMEPADVCGDGFRGRSTRPAGETAESVPLGVFERLLLATSPDGYGILSGFVLFDLETGQAVYEDAYADARGIAFQHGRDGPVLTYWAQLGGFDCVPRARERGCWARIRAKHRIPATVPAPDCEAVIARSPSVLTGQPDRALQLALHVRVPRLSRRDAVYLSDRPDCAAAP